MGGNINSINRGNLTNISNIQGKVNVRGTDFDANVTLNDFRNMVNTTDGAKNKGYVRLKLNSDGKVGIEKFNNKINVNLFFRSYTRTERGDDKAVRKMFADALNATSDLKYMSEENRQTIINTLRIGNTENQPARKKYDALSRLETKAVLNAYDAEMNTINGRKAILGKFIDNVRNKFGLADAKHDITCTNDEIFAALGVTMDEYESYLISQSVNAEEGVEHDKAKTTMLKSAEDFSAFLRKLEKASNNLTYLHIAERKLEQIFNSFKNDNSTVLTEEQSGMLKGAFLYMMDTDEKLKTAYTGVDEKYVLNERNKLLDLMVNEVTPVFVNKKITKGDIISGGVMKNAGKNANELITYFQKFITQADANIKQYYLDQENENKKIDDTIKSAENADLADESTDLKAVLAEYNAKMNKFAKILADRDKRLNRAKLFSENANMGEKTAFIIGSSSVDGEIETIHDTILESFTDAFIEAEFPEESKFHEKCARDQKTAIEEQVSKEVLSAQVVYGKIQDNKCKGTDFSTYNNKMVAETLKTITNKYKGGPELYKNLCDAYVTYTNRKIEQANNNNSSISFDANDPKDIAYFNALSEAYDKFDTDNDKSNKILHDSYEAFKKSIDDICNDGLIEKLLGRTKQLVITARLRNELKNITGKFEAQKYFDAALTKFFNNPPSINLSSNKDELKNDAQYLVSLSVKKLTELLNAEIRAGVMQLKQQAIGLIFNGKGITPPEDFIKNLYNNPADSEDNPIRKSFNTADDAVNALGPVYCDIMLKKAAKIKANSVTIESVQNEVKEAALKLVGEKKATFDNTVRKILEQELDERLSPFFTSGTNNWFDVDDYFADKVGASEHERQILKKALFDDLCIQLNGKLSQLGSEFFTNPDFLSAKKNVEDLVKAEILDNTMSEGFFSTVNSIVAKRKETLVKWIGNNEFKESIVRAGLDHIRKSRNVDSTIEGFNVIAQTAMNQILDRYSKQSVLHGTNFDTDANRDVFKEKVISAMTPGLMDFVDKYIIFCNAASSLEGDYLRYAQKGYYDNIPENDIINCFKSVVTEVAGKYPNIDLKEDNGLSEIKTAVDTKIKELQEKYVREKQAEVGKKIDAATVIEMQIRYQFTNLWSSPEIQNAFRENLRPLVVDNADEVSTRNAVTKYMDIVNLDLKKMLIDEFIEKLKDNKNIGTFLENINITALLDNIKKAVIKRVDKLLVAITSIDFSTPEGQKFIANAIGLKKEYANSKYTTAIQNGIEEWVKLLNTDERNKWLLDIKIQVMNEVSASSRGKYFYSVKEAGLDLFDRLKNQLLPFLMPSINQVLFDNIDDETPIEILDNLIPSIIDSMKQHSDDETIKAIIEQFKPTAKHFITKRIAALQEQIIERNKASSDDVPKVSLDDVSEFNSQTAMNLSSELTKEFIKMVKDDFVDTIINNLVNSTIAKQANADSATGNCFIDFTDNNYYIQTNPIEKTRYKNTNNLKDAIRECLKKEFIPVVESNLEELSDFSKCAEIFETTYTRVFDNVIKEQTAQAAELVSMVTSLLNIENDIKNPSSSEIYKNLLNSYFESYLGTDVFVRGIKETDAQYKIKEKFFGVLLEKFVNSLSKNSSSLIKSISDVTKDSEISKDSLITVYDSSFEEVCSFLNDDTTPVAKEFSSVVKELKNTRTQFLKTQNNVGDKPKTKGFFSKIFGLFK